MLGKYGDIPVSTYTGIPTIAQPLLTIHDGNLHLPLALSYHASGIKVQEEAGWLGLGWSLEAGGSITRVVNGLPDEHARGFLGSPNSLTLSAGTQVQTSYLLQGSPPRTVDELQLLNQFVTGFYDSQQDDYFYHINGRSGRIVIDTQGNARTSPVSDLSVQLLRDGARLGFMLTDASGLTYSFGATDVTYSATNAVETNSAITYVSAWYLTQIRSPQQEVITFYYTANAYAHDAPLTVGAIYTETLDFNSSSPFLGIQPYQHQDQDVLYSAACLDSIRAGTTLVNLFSSSRADDPTLPLLDSLQVSDYGGLTRHSYCLNYSYTGGTTNIAAPGSGITNDGKERPLLASLLVDQTLHYTFAYSPLPAVAPNTPATTPIHRQDHWGYYNGGYRGQPPAIPESILPAVQYTYKTGAGNTVVVNTNGCNRAPSQPDMLAYTIRRITYPTGGYTDYDFEANTYGYKLDTSPAGHGNYIPVADTTFKNRRFTRGLPAANARTGVISIIDSVYIEFSQIITLTSRVSGDMQGAGSGATYVALLPRRDADVIGESYYFDDGSHPSTVGSPASQPIQKTYSQKLRAGWYYLASSVLNSGSNPGRTSFSIDYKSINGPIRHYALGGGLRIKEVRSYIPGSLQPALRTSYRYVMPQDSSRSSGVLATPIPSYSHLYKLVNEQGGYAVFLITNSSPTSYIGATGGAPVGYRQVAVTRDSAATQGTEVFTYSSPVEVGAISALASQNFPYPPADVPEDQSGLLLQHLVYRGPVSDSILVERRRLRYHSLGTAQRHYGIATSVKYGVATQALLSSEATSSGASELELAIGASNVGLTSEKVLAKPYWKSIDWVYPTWEEQTSFNPTTGLAYTRVTTRQLDSLTLLPLLTTVTDAAGHTQLTQTRYASTYDTLTFSSPLSPLAQGIRALLRRHVWTAPIESRHLRSLGGDTLLTGGQLTLYQPQVLLPRTQFQLALPVPLPAAALAPITFSGGNGSLDAHYQPRVELQRYDTYGNVLQARQSSGTLQSSLWGYGHQHIVAHVVNAAYPQVASTSFEPDATGRWQYDSTGTHRVLGGRTGQWAYRLDGQQSALTRAQLPAGTYLLTYWLQSSSPASLLLSIGSQSSPTSLIAMTSGGWHQFQTQLQVPAKGSVQLDVPATGGQPLLDDVRLYPVGALLTSYTYDPLAGVTSQTGPDGRTVFYEYDGLGRLLRTRDEQGRILSQQQYHYAGQH